MNRCLRQRLRSESLNSESGERHGSSDVIRVCEAASEDSCAVLSPQELDDRILDVPTLMSR